MNIIIHTETKFYELVLTTEKDPFVVVELLNATVVLKNRSSVSAKMLNPLFEFHHLFVVVSSVYAHVCSPSVDMAIIS